MHRRFEERAMTYGQYRPQEQQQLIDRINQIRGGR